MKTDEEILNDYINAHFADVVPVCISEANLRESVRKTLGFTSYIASIRVRELCLEILRMCRLN